MILDAGGPMFRISVDKKIIPFEMHPYCGPNILKRNGEPLKNQPPRFLKAASLWAKQGQRVEGGLCVWDHNPEEILQHVGGPNWKIVGYKPARKGE